MSSEQFADVIRAKYCVDVTSDDVRHATGGKDSVTFKDFTGFCKAYASALPTPPLSRSSHIYFNLLTVPTAPATS